MSARLFGALLRISRGLSSQPVSVLIDELMETEMCPTRKAKLLAVKFGTNGLKGALEEAKHSLKVLQNANDRALEEAKHAHNANDRALETLTAYNVKMELDLLRTRGLNNTRGLFEFLQQKIHEQYPQTRNMRPTATSWNLVLSYDRDLRMCLRKHVKKGDLGLHLATIYELLSQHVHAGNDLSQHKGTIVFEVDFLSPQQVHLMVCLGNAAKVPIAPAAKRV